MRGVPSQHSKIKRMLSNKWKVQEFCQRAGGKLYVDYEHDEAVCEIGDTRIEAGDFYLFVVKGGDVLYDGFGVIKNIEPDRIIVNDGEEDEELSL